MLSEIGIITISALKTVYRKKTVLFSAFILPIITLVSIWWVTADQLMIFSLENGDFLAQNQLYVHILTGGLTAIAITASIFGFILTAENQKLSQRLQIVGYSPIAINLGWFFSLLLLLVFSSIGTFFLTIKLFYPANVVGLFVAILLTTIIYSALGYFVGSLYPKLMEGTLIVLIFSFIDLMLFSNPMGVEIYLKPWTYYLPGFWPTQLVLHSGFFESSPHYLKAVGYVFLETGFLVVLPAVIKSKPTINLINKLKKVYSFGK